MNESMPFDYRSLCPNTFDYRACLECDRGNVCRSPCFNIEPRSTTTPTCCNQQPFYAPSPQMCVDPTRCHQAGQMASHINSPTSAQGPPHMTPQLQAQMSPPMSPQPSAQQPHQQYTHNPQHPQQYTQHQQQPQQQKKLPTQKKTQNAAVPNPQPAKECKKHGRNHSPTASPAPEHIVIPAKEIPSVITLYKKKSLSNATSSQHCGIVEDFHPVPKEDDTIYRKPTGTTATQYLLPDQVSPEFLGPQIFQQVIRQLQYCNHPGIGDFLKKYPPYLQQPNGMCQNSPCCNCSCYNNNCMCYQQQMHSPQSAPPATHTWNMGHY